MPRFTACAQSLYGSLTHKIDVNGRHTTVTDVPHALGGADCGPAPHELLAATLASCISTTILVYAHRRMWELDSVRVDVEYYADETPRRFGTAVHLPVGVTGERAERLLRVAETCPVRRALEAGFTFADRLSTDLASQPAHLTTPGQRAA